MSNDEFLEIVDSWGGLAVFSAVCWPLFSFLARELLHAHEQGVRRYTVRGFAQRFCLRLWGKYERERANCSMKDVYSSFARFSGSQPSPLWVGRKEGTSEETLSMDTRLLVEFLL